MITSSFLLSGNSTTRYCFIESLRLSPTSVENTLLTNTKGDYIEKVSLQNTVDVRDS